MKTILSGTLFLMSALLCHAQTVSIIPKAGVCIHTLGGDDYYDYIRKNGIGLAAGVAAGIRLSKKNNLALQPEVMFLTKGGKFIDTPLDGLRTGDDVYRIYYLEIPLLLKLSSNQGQRKIGFFVNAGPSLGIGGGGEFKVIDSYNRPDVAGYELGITFDYEESYLFNRAYFDERIDFSLQAGAGMTYQLGPVKLIMEARYGHGLREFINERRQAISMVNRFWLFSAGVQIPGGR